MDYTVWFARGFANQKLLSNHDNFTAAVSAANEAAALGSEDIEVVDSRSQTIYRIGFSKIDEFVNW
jgi:hypothetical protein